MFTGLALQAIALGWLASVASPTVAYSSLVVPFILAGTGMALVFAPVANMILSSVDRSDEGKASGANNAIREVGGTLGVAVLASVFSREGKYARPARDSSTASCPPCGSEPSCSPAARCSPWPCRAGGRARESAARAGAAASRRARARHSSSAHREHERARSRHRPGRDAGAQRELAGMHDRERGHEASSGVDTRLAHTAPPGRRQRLQLERAPAQLGEATADPGDGRRRRGRCGTTTRRSGRRRAAMRTSTRARRGREPHRRGPGARDPHRGDSAGVRTHAAASARACRSARAARCGDGAARAGGRRPHAASCRPIRATSARTGDARACGRAAAPRGTPGATARRAPPGGPPALAGRVPPASRRTADDGDVPGEARGIPARSATWRTR